MEQLGEQRSDQPFRPIHDIQRRAELSETARTPLEGYKVSLRRYSPVQKGTAGLPWPGEWYCSRCGETAPGAVWMEKTCPEHGYFRDKVDSNARLRRLLTQRSFQDEVGVERPQVAGAVACPTDCGLCDQHHSSPCLAQIDLTNRCNLTCPVCFASANQAASQSEPGYEIVAEMLQALRSMTLKQYGRAAEGKRAYRTLMAAGMHFMDRYNYDTERVRRCVILYSTPDGMYPFCTINCGPVYRPYIEEMTARPLGA